MPTSVLSDPSVQEAFDLSRRERAIKVRVDGREQQIATPFPSPADWRDLPIYFLLVDRFNNSRVSPRFGPYDREEDRFQGGTLEGIRSKIPYLKELGVGAIWLSPILKNPWYFDKFYGGYGIQDFLTVEPRFTSNPQAARGDPTIGQKELRALVDTAHAHGLYIILDIVLNHVGNVFDYEGARDLAPWRGLPEPEYTIYWRDQTGSPKGTWTDIQKVLELQPRLDPDAAIWPRELQRNDYFRRRGADGPIPQGDFCTFKELVTDYRADGAKYPVREVLIRTYQYLIAQYDVDGFRIDTLMYVERECARTFGNAVREFALSIGKRNFFTFGEVWRDDDQADARIAEFVGRNTADADEIVGVDAATDFPIRRRLWDVCKGLKAPSDLAAYYQYRKEAQRSTISSHGDASRFFVSLLENHDLNERFYYQDPGDPTKYDRQFTLALTCLFCLQGIPCLYYGSEQGLHGRGARCEAVREALWGKPDAFDVRHPFFGTIQRLAQLRARQPALRYGRQYFRAVSGDGNTFNISEFQGGVMAVSRVLNDDEVLLAGNMNTTAAWRGYIVIDHDLHQSGDALSLLVSNCSGASPPGQVTDRSVYRAIPVTLQPMEAQVIGGRR